MTFQAKLSSYALMVVYNVRKAFSINKGIIGTRMCLGESV